MRHAGRVRIPDERRRARLARSHLLRADQRVERATEAADALVALHSSDPATVFLSAAARLRDPTIAAIEAELYDDRTLVRHHSMRRTLWVMTTEVARLAHAGFSRKIAAAERRRTATLFSIGESQVAAAIDRVVAVVESADDPVTTRVIAAALPDLAEPIVVNRGKPYEGTMALHTRALLVAAFEARIARARPGGSWIASQYAWAPHGRWTGGDSWSDEPDELTGASAVVGRYLDAFGPATLEDVVWWTGATKTLVRRALDACGAREIELEHGATGYVAPDDEDADDDGDPWVALLPGLDPTAMGWKHRDWYLDPALAREVTDRNGNIGPTVWADGRVVGGWVQRPDGSIAHDAELDAVHARLLDDEIDRVRSFVGETRFSVRFPSPNQRRLLGG